VVMSERIKVPEPSVYHSEVALEAKIVLLGDSGTGKTSLLQRYANDIFPDETTTVGAGFAHKRILMNDVKIKLLIWDTAGQERFRSMAPMYYRGAAGAVLVFDITDLTSFHAVKGWIKELNEAALTDGDLRNIVICIAGNKKDLEHSRQVAAKDAMAYANSIGASYIETSAKNNEGLHELFIGVCQRILEGEGKGKRTSPRAKTTRRDRKQLEASTTPSTEKKKFCFF